MPVVVIYNPVSGNRTAEQLFREHVLPLLAEHNKRPVEVIATTHPNHAGEAILALRKQFSDSDPLTLVLGSGDGTLHEIVSALHQSPPERHFEITIALIPCGTANALYSSFFPPAQNEDVTAISYRFKSLNRFLTSPSPSRVPLSSAYVTLAASTGVTTQTSAAAVVVSTALHAAILHDSEELRATHPGIERFKMAAAKNITQWSNARVRLLPLPDQGKVEQYDPVEGRLLPTEHAGGQVELDGPFAYFLSTINVDRLEPAFRIAPLYTTARPTSAALDVVIVRPLNSPNITHDSEETRVQFAQTLAAVLGGAYQDGAHIDYGYAEDGSAVPEGKVGPVVEYFRCGGWEWTPDTSDNRAHMVCVDGEILTIESGGKVSVKARGEINAVSISIFA
ncbi:hypothetical protein K474DRAFT_1691670 [Panus rudis PR-1116 ss-1]|nr:hypothetical protein K474DRAFT_1691670 [Panus rudis PR-1116 ss-1]